MQKSHFALAGALTLSACTGDIHEPTFCVYRGTEVQASALASDPCPSPSQPAAGEALIFVHDLPDDVEVDDQLELTLSTPCTTITTRHDHPEQRSMITSLAPPGAECLLTVSATILNASNTLSIGPSGNAACAALDDVCKPPP